jgi:2-pyrone-4,6-dicarboxylate lactonase
LDALKEVGPNYQGCAIGMVLLQKGNERLIQKLADSRIGGVRFNFMKRLNMMPEPTDFNRAVDQLRELGWYAKMQPDMNGIIDSVGLYENIEDVPIIIDHMARADVSLGLNDPNVKKVLEMLKKGNFWIMLSNGYRISKMDHPWSDVRTVASAYIEAAPDRVIWSTDWPHPLAKKPSPNDTDLLELLYSYTDSDEELRKILVDNPAELFGFPLPD